MTKTERPQTARTRERAELDSTLGRLGYGRLPHGGAECVACGTKFVDANRPYWPDGPVLRSHRRNCPVNPQSVYTPGVCDA